MADALPSIRVTSIRLIDFRYDLEYNPAEGTTIGYRVEAMHRVRVATKRLDVRVNITYLDKDPNRSEPLLFASGITTYRLDNVKIEEATEEGGEAAMLIPEEMLKRARIEAVAHARALLAMQTAATPFGRTHIQIKDEMYAELPNFQEITDE